MKRLLTLLATITLTIGAQSQNVTTQRAHTVADNYLKSYSPTKSGDTLTLAKTYHSSDGLPMLYVFNIGDHGFIITCADTNFDPVFGYSFNGTFDEKQAPANLKSWIEGFVEDADAVKRAETLPDDILRQQKEWNKEWRALSAGTVGSKGGKSVDILLETKWSQGYGYNEYCPVYGSGHSVTGCVATAMAQIIRYHQYPSRGFSNHSYSHSIYGVLEVFFDSVTYNYNNMPTSVGYYSSAAQRQAVSLLCYHCGVAVNMNYESTAHTSGSGAYSQDVPKGLKYFGYFDSYFMYKTSVSSDKWDSLLRHDLDLQRPIYYSGSSSEGGHAFVCDGYNNNNKYHFNFGWGGAGDGYYTLSSVNGYATSQAAVLNIYPSNLGPYQEPYYIAADGEGDGSSWNNANPNLHGALEIAKLYSKGRIWVKSGTYYGDTNSNVAFGIDRNITVIGGFAGTEQSADDRSADNAPTILSGRNERKVLQATSLTKESKIVNVTFANGMADDGSGVTLSNNLILERCTIEHNGTTGDGAAITLNNGTLRQCIISNNHCAGANINDCQLRNCLVAHNEGDGVRSNGGTVDGSTIVCNSGTGIVNNNTKIRNCVVWRNGNSLADSSISKITFSAIEGFADKDSNSNFGLVADNDPYEGGGPIFMSPNTTIGPVESIGDWHISSRSPLVDAGDTLHKGSYSYDLDGGGRFRNGRVDIGCYEWIPGNGINGAEPLNAIRVYPNPASATIYVETSAGTIQVFDMMDRRILAAQSDGTPTTLDVSDLPHGVYLLRTNGTTTKFIKK